MFIYICIKQNPIRPTMRERLVPQCLVEHHHMAVCDLNKRDGVSDKLEIKHSFSTSDNICFTYRMVNKNPS